MSTPGTQDRAIFDWIAHADTILRLRHRDAPLADEQMYGGPVIGPLPPWSWHQVFRLTEMGWRPVHSKKAHP